MSQHGDQDHFKLYGTRRSDGEKAKAARQAMSHQGHGSPIDASARREKHAGPRRVPSGQSGPRSDEATPIRPVQREARPRPPLDAALRLAARSLFRLWRVTDEILRFGRALVSRQMELLARRGEARVDSFLFHRDRPTP